jgi:phenylpropionate dioxygenase-like ring-hydroxylating dioxygenase large terminal subunit
MPDGENRTVRADARFGQGYVTDAWYVVGLGRDLRPGRPRRIELQGEPLMLGRSPGGQLFALRDICPHRAAPLSAGTFHRDDFGVESIACPYHGWRFRPDGACSGIPSLATGQEMDVGRIRVRRYPIRESQGLIFVWIGQAPEAEPDHDPPTFPGVVGGGPKLVDRMVFDAHIDQAVVGLMDPAHGPFVHRQWWWRTAASVHDKEKRFEPRDAGFAMVRHAPSSNSRAYSLLGGRPATEIVFQLPGLRWEHIEVGRRQVLALTCLAPLDAGRTQVLQVVWSDHPILTLLKPVVGLMARVFLRQDARMVDLQNQGLKHDPTLLWIDDADRQAKWYQALKREWAAARREGRSFQNPVKAATLRWRS